MDLICGLAKKKKKKKKKKTKETRKTKPAVTVLLQLMDCQSVLHQRNIYEV